MTALNEEIKVLISDIKNKIDEYKKQESLKNVWLFGSIAKGTYRKFSDVDILIDCGDDYLLFADLCDAIDDIDTYRRFDIHDLRNAHFKFDLQEVYDHGIRLYPEI